MSKLKIGVFGLWRGMEYVRQFTALDDTEVVAVCDMDDKKFAEARKVCGENVKCFTDYDQLLDSGLDAVVLCNYFNEHAPCAIRALDKGIDVMSECTAGATLKECVELCEAVERSGRRYMLAENYPFSLPMREFTRLCQGGTLGDILYAEGEYNHTGPRSMLAELTPFPRHWRAWLPRTYYVTHALGPLMYATGQMPVSVSANAVHSKVLEQYDDFRHNFDALAMMNVVTDKGALFRVTGCTAMASHSGYRIVGENGSCETGRTLGTNVALTYQPWLIPEGACEVSVYKPNLPDHSSSAGHGGGDYFTCYYFTRYALYGEKPFFDVYRACAMSAVGILGWRSCLQGGKPFAIPDFARPESRDQVRSDDLTPFPDAEGRVTLPCAVPVK